MKTDWLQFFLVLFAMIGGGVVLCWHYTAPENRDERGAKPIHPAMLQPVKHQWLLRVFQMTVSIGVYYLIVKFGPSIGDSYAPGFLGALVSFVATEILLRWRSRAKEKPFLRIVGHCAVDASRGGQTRNGGTDI